MAYREFGIGPVGGLRAAAAKNLPNLVVVAGPNGSGKSTLLHHLYTHRADLAEPGTSVAYLGPHRTWRKAPLSGPAMSEFYPSLTAYLQDSHIPNWKTFQPTGFRHVMPGELRDHGATDDTFSFVKAAIVNLDRRLQILLRRMWEERNHNIAPGDVPDLLEPLRLVVRKLLPHLTLLRVDSSDEHDIRVIFQRMDGPHETEVELDKLSSGEKSVVGLSLALTEPAVEQLLAHATAPSSPLSTLIIDEPETHLHPTLQVLLIEYLTELAENDAGQFIVATQSPTIIDVLDDESLFLLAPAAVVPSGNQLLAIGRAQPRLELMRSLTGSTHLLTRCRPIVFLEGELPAARPISDQRLVELLIPQAQGWVLIAAGGRGTAASSARQLRQAAVDTLPGVPIFALVDRDQASVIDEDFVIAWPVAMIENLLLDPGAIWAVLEPHREQLALGSQEEVGQALVAGALNLRSTEVRLRVRSLLQPVSARVRAECVDDLSSAVERARLEIDEQFGVFADRNRMVAEFQAAEDLVPKIVEDKLVLERFRGKNILKDFHDAHVNRCGLSYKAFVYAVAREAVERPRLANLILEPVRRLERYIPVSLVEIVERVVGSPAVDDPDRAGEALLVRLRIAREAWEKDGDVQEDLDLLRKEVLALAQLLPAAMPEALAVINGAAQLGVRSAVPY